MVKTTFVASESSLFVHLIAAIAYDAYPCGVLQATIRPRCPLFWRVVLASEKIVSVSFRLSPHVKGLLVAAASLEKRSLTNMLEVLLERHCLQAGISIAPPASNNHKNG